jgi:hypothetical protein
MRIKAVEFRNKVEMKNFSYEGALGLGEEAVKQAVSVFLETKYSVSQL